ncbi:MAG: M15 family metallopeptidase, partial [Bacteroidales bacterium]|nr:M15 family metallopeptidase [Bacteroidales bacterium]
NGEPYAFNRDTAQFPYKITRDDLACQLFRKAGFNWGGSLPKSKDYQHFQWME